MSFSCNGFGGAFGMPCRNLADYGKSADCGCNSTKPHSPGQLYGWGCSNEYPGNTATDARQ